MKELNFLIGSGIHNGYLPSVDDLTKKIINLEDDEIDDLHPPGRKEIRKKFRIFIKVICDKIKKYYKDLKIIPNYEDLFYVLIQLYDDIKGNRYNPAIEDFRNDIFIKNNFDVMSKEFFKEAEIFFDYLEPELFSEFKRIIRKELSLENYPENKLIENLSLFKKILTTDNTFKDHSLNIFSLNHDLAFETFFRVLKIDFFDGFTKKSSILSNRSFIRKHDPKIEDFYLDNKVKLIKLHGSLDWYHKNKENILDDVIYKQDNMSHGLDEEEDSSFLIGVYNKTEQYSYKIYNELFHYLYHTLNNNNLIIVSGYGFQDTTINLYLSNWLIKNHRNKVILIHPNIKMLLENSYKENFIRKIYQPLKNSNRLIEVVKSFCNVSISDII
jgi:hypothetical protein